MECIKSSEDVSKIVQLLTTNLTDRDLRCTYLASKTLHDLAKVDQYLPVLIKHQQLWQGKPKKLLRIVKMVWHALTSHPKASYILYFCTIIHNPCFFLV